MSAKTDFNERLPKKLEEDPDAAASIGATFHFDISGDDGGQWTMSCKEDLVGITAGLDGDADCTITCTDEVWTQMSENPGAAMQLFFSGQLKVSGNAMLATGLQKILR